ncbi:hypothetical protein I7X30_05170 [Capnocytophaga sp. 051621]|jgi:hypothetical protein|uniref:Uncharacterized protein n=2 Tax=Capnocytophaga TaxID=1016 RepID=A0ABS1YSN8_9FLAO|nr:MULTISPECIES: hypothetical protein [Capnocytophaga]MBI1646449.1 hypothetical protein [Capnocytophaga periodontitidis]MBM0649417.1 hypothetical protein [Capnocytophaga genosp. AHN8471]MBM0661237.1 hypothetical protein [Capnocytophaga genosp. AHN8471]
MTENISIDFCLEKIVNYWCKYIGCEIYFTKKELNFIADFLPLIDTSLLPVPEENIQKQLENIKNDDEVFLENSKSINIDTFDKIKDALGDKILNEKELALENLLACFFICSLEYDDLIIEYASYDLLVLEVSEKIIIEKLYQHFGDIINYQE